MTSPDTEPTKAYYVRERFVGYKTQLVFAHTAAEAGERCRHGDIEVCVGNDGPHPAGISKVWREPSEDRHA